MTTDEALDQIVAHWDKAKGLDADAVVLEMQADNLRKMADDERMKADGLIEPLVDMRPEWRDPFMEELDPRVMP